MSGERKHPLALCEQCPLQRERAVQSHGTETAEYAVVGEAPGRQERAKGIPFIGPSGKLLDAVLDDAGIERSNVYATNTVLCRPPGKDADVPDKAVRCCRPRLKAELESLPNLKRVLAVGNTAATELLGYTTKITKDRIGNPRPAKDYDVEVVPSIHPAAILRASDNFPTFVRDVHKLNQTFDAWKPPHYEVMESKMGSKAALDSIPQGAEVVVDIETTVEKDNVFEHPENLLCVGVATSPGRAFVIPKQFITNYEVKDRLAEMLHRANVIYHNGKFDVSVLWQQLCIIDLNGAIYGDTMLASYCLDERPGHHSLDELSRDLLGSPNWKHVTKEYESFEAMPPDVLHEYNSYDIANTYRLWETFRPQLIEQEQVNLHKMLCYFAENLITVEHRGIKVDTNFMGKLENEMVDKLDELEGELSQWVDNPRSWQQVMFALYSTFGVETPSTDKEHLNMILNGAKQAGMEELTEFIETLLAHRKQTKLLGTYVRGIMSRLTPQERIKPNLTLHFSDTGRTTSKNPNLQNIPRGWNIRDAFIPDDDKHQLAYADFNNIEGRIVAVLSNDQKLQEIFASGKKPHKVVAEAAFGPDFDSEQYVAAKSVVHGVNYMRTPHGIAEGEGIPLDRAKYVYDLYMDLASGLPDWHDEIKKRVLVDQEDLVTPFGRRRRFHLITSKNQDEVLRQAVAFQPQSIASDLNMLAACALNQAGYDVRLMVHDAVLLQLPKWGQDELIIDIKKIMQDTAESNYPFIDFPVEVGIGDSWGECE